MSSFNKKSRVFEPKTSKLEHWVTHGRR